MAGGMTIVPVNVTLTGPQKKRLVDMLVQVFEDYESLKYALRVTEPGIALPTIAPPGPIQQVTLEVVDKAARDHWLPVLRDMVFTAVDGRGPVLKAVDDLYREIARNRRVDPARETGRPLPLTLLYCHVQLGMVHAIDDQQLEERLYALQDRLVAFVSDANGAVPWQQNDGFLATFASPSVAVEVALAMQRATGELAAQGGEHEPVRIGYGLGLRVLPPGITVGPLSPFATVTRAIAALADHGQILMTAAVADTVLGASLGVPRERIAWANHGDCIVTPDGDLRTLYEVADKDFRDPKPPEAAAIAHPGQGQLKFAGYALLDRLTLSGSTVVYKASQIKDGSVEPVAIKVLVSQVGGRGTEMRSAFLAPLRALREIEHPGIIRIREVREEALPYFVMDWIEGSHLDAVMAERTRDEDRLALAIKVCDALEAAHANGIVHGDLKPSNIVVRASDCQPIILDFGQHDWVPTPLTDTTNQGAVGTPLYVAPELIAGLLPLEAGGGEGERAVGELPAISRVSVASDIYSLGSLLYECFVGHPPFDFGNRQAVLDAQVNADPPLPRIEHPDFNLDLEAVLLKAMEKYPAARYQSAAELRDDLEMVLRGEKVTARPHIYNNMMETRARSAMRNIDLWKKEQHITDAEHGRLRRAFDLLLRSGLSAVGESRLTHLPIVLLYLLGAVLISGLTFFLKGDAQNELSHELRLAFGVIIPVVSVLVWVQMRGVGRYRVAFAIGVISVSSLPLAVANTLYEVIPGSTSISIHEGCAFLGNPGESCRENGDTGEGANPATELDVADQSEPEKYPNWQVFVGLLTALVWARYVSIRSGTVTLATMSAILLTATYLVLLDFIGWRYFVSQDLYHQVGFWLIPLAAIALIYPDVSRALGFSNGGRRKEDQPDPAWERERRRLALPFVNTGMLVLIVAFTLIAFNWSDSLGPRLIPNGTYGDTEVMRGLMIAIAGVFFYIVADRVARRAFPDAVVGYWLLYFTGIVYAIAGLLWADDQSSQSSIAWMPQWGLPDIPRPMTLAVPVALVLAILVILDSARLNSRGAMTVGVGLVVAVLLYVEYFFFIQGNGQSWWAYLLMACGSVGLVAVCSVQLKPSRRPDIDDVGERLVREERARLK